MDLDPDEEAIPNPRAISLSRIEALTGKLIAGLRKWWGVTPEGEDFNAFVRDICIDLPKAPFANVYMSLLHLAGMQLDAELLGGELWRLVANYEQLQKGPVPPWSRQVDLEWVPVEVAFANFSRDSRNRPGAFYALKFLAGTPTGKLHAVFWTYKQSRLYARKFGFTGFRARPQFLMTDIKDLVGMRFYVLLNPKRSPQGGFGFVRMHCPASMLQSNKKILRMRSRYDPCPLGYLLSELPCHRCHLGYESCMAAVHPEDWEVKFCPRCNTEGWFDPLGPGNACEACLDKQRRGKDEA